MRKVLMVLGGVFLALVVFVGAGIGYIAIKGSALDREAKVYADAAIPAIVGNWDVIELEKRESPEFRSAMKTSDLDKLFQMFRRLGTLKDYKGAKGQAMMSATTQKGSQITANYAAAADFEAGPAEINIGLIKHGEEWQIMRFRVNSRVFLDQR